MLILRGQGIRWQSQGMVDRSADMCGDAHGNRESAVGGEVAAEDREERRLCYGGSESKYFFLSGSYWRMNATDRYSSSLLRSQDLMMSGMCKSIAIVERRNPLHDSRPEGPCMY